MLSLARIGASPRARDLRMLASKFTSSQCACRFRLCRPRRIKVNMRRLSASNDMNNEQPGRGAGLSGRSRDPRRRRRSSASIRMRRRCFSPAIARSRSSARCAFRFSTIRRSPSARRPAKPRSRSTRPTRRKSTAASSPSRAKPTAGSRSAAPARRSNGRSRCAASTNSRTLDHLAGEIDDALAEALGRAVAAAHAQAPAVEAEAVDRRGRLLYRRARRRRSANAHEDLSGGGDRRARAREPRPPMTASSRSLRERGRRGLIRRIHGDLHLGNIVLIDGRPVLFDAIEFSRHHRLGRRALRSRLPADGPARARAARRRRTSCSTAISPRRGASRTSTRLRRCRSFCRCARRSAPRSRRRGMELRRRAERAGDRRVGARLFRFRAARRSRRRSRDFVAVGGLSGTGKTRARAQRSRRGSGRCPAPSIVRSDVERKALFGVGETEKLPADAYTAEVTARVYATLADKARRIVAAGHSAIVDAVFAQPRERDGVGRGRESSRERSACADCFSPPNLADPARPRRRTPKRRLRCRRRTWRGRRRTTTSGSLEWRLIDASGTPEETAATGPRGAGLTKRSAADIKPPRVPSTRLKVSPCETPSSAKEAPGNGE